MSVFFLVRGERARRAKKTKSKRKHKKPQPTNTHHPIRHHASELHQQAAVPAHHALVVPPLEPRRQRDRVARPPHNHRASGGARHRHAQRLAHDGPEIEDARVEVDGAEGARGHDHGAEARKHGPHGQAGVQARELQHRVGHVGQALVVRLHHDRKPACRVSPQQRREIRHQLQRQILVRIRDLKGGK